MFEKKPSKAQIKKINKQLIESVENYRKCLRRMSSDAPIGALCLAQNIEKILLDQGYSRINELLDLDLTKIKGIGDKRARYLAACLDQFLAMC